MSLIAEVEILKNLTSQNSAYFEGGKMLFCPPQNGAYFEGGKIANLEGGKSEADALFSKNVCYKIQSGITSNFK